MAFTARSAGAADTPAQTFAWDARRRPMVQAQRALQAAARTRKAALRCRERNAAGSSPWGPPGI